MPDAKPANLFDEHPEIYDALIDWPKRLANEEPFYRQLFSQIGAKRVLDAACGSGHHAAMFHSWGLEVQGADLSVSMIEHCRKSFGQPAGLSWAVRSFDQTPEPAEQFDAAVCVGNSLALAPDMETISRAIDALLSAVRPGGAVVIQVLNLWHLPEGKCLWQKCKRLAIDGIDHVLLKGIHRVGAQGFVELIALELVDDRVKSQFHSATFMGLEAAELISSSPAGGVSEVQVYGSYKQEPYDRQESSDLILVCRK